MLLAITTFVVLTLGHPSTFVVNWTEGNEADITFAGQRYIVQVVDSKVAQSVQVPVEDATCGQ